MRLWYVQAGQAGQRLDQALTSLLPGLGLRGRRRLLENGRVLLNGHPAGAACRVREGTGWNWLTPCLQSQARQG